MGSVFSDVTDSIGLTDHGAADAAAAQSAAAQEASNVAADRSYALTTEELEFQREQYDEWKAVYGDLQEDLGDYFKNITGDKITADQLQEVQKQSQIAQEQIDQSLAQRGIAGGGLEAQSVIQNELGVAQQKATIRSNQERVAAEQQLGFLGVGLGQGTEMLGINAQVASAGASSQASQASSFLGSSVGFGSTSAGVTNQNTSNITNKSMEMGESMSGIFSDRNLKTDLVKQGTHNGINFYTWTWNKLANQLGLVGTGFGVIAQEVKALIPDSVTMVNSYYQVNYEEVLKYTQGAK